MMSLLLITAWIIVLFDISLFPATTASNESKKNINNTSHQSIVKNVDPNKSTNKNDFIYLYNLDSFTVIYHTLSDFGHFKYHIQMYYRDHKEVYTYNNLVLLLFLQESHKQELWKIELTKLNMTAGLKIYFSEYDLNQYFQSKMSALENLQSFSVEEKELMRKWIQITHLQSTNHSLHDTLNRCYQDVEEIINVGDITLSSFDPTHEVYLMKWWRETLHLSHNLDFTVEDLAQFLNMYEPRRFKRIKSYPQQITMSLKDVYYVNKEWFKGSPVTGEKVRFIPDNFTDDFEYKKYQHHDIPGKLDKKIHSIDNMHVHQVISEDVVYLDYLYGYYNFGEFWDCIIRLMLSSKKYENMKLFHLAHHRVNDIDYYFKKLGFNVSGAYIVHKDKVTYFENNVYLSLILGTNRGYYDRFISYQFNKLFNNHQYQHMEDQISYNIYLSRGKHGRGIVDEHLLISDLVSKYNFTIINGSESNDKIRHYFTNARVVMGAHGSLMKNMIWSRKRALLVELSPLSRLQCFYGNCKQSSLRALYISCDADKNERIIFTDERRDALLNLVGMIVKKLK